ncbi:MAG: DNA-binding response regulator [Acidobacteria bacterium 13_1_40CM_2_56_5]|nr:MAG: DNA-binding response regulator [Acidobacteria bacterium 13_1_40CM_2_56_5]
MTKPGAKPVRVLLADDHKLVRAGFRAMLDSLGDVEIVGETGDGREALELIRQHRPDVALLDITMPSLTGLEVAARVANEMQNVRIIILSMHTTEDYIARAVRAGVSGYLLKNADPVELELALRAAVNGQMYMSPTVSKQLVEDYLRRMGPDAGPEEQLTARQREILQLIAEGKSTKDIAVTLDLSIKTVETHRKDLMDRLGIHDVAGLVRYAIRAGIIKAD